MGKSTNQSWPFSIPVMQFHDFQLPVDLAPIPPGSRVSPLSTLSISACHRLSFRVSLARRSKGIEKPLKIAFDTSKRKRPRFLKTRFPGRVEEIVEVSWATSDKWKRKNRWPKWQKWRQEAVCLICMSSVFPSCFWFNLFSQCISGVFPSTRCLFLLSCLRRRFGEISKKSDGRRSAAKRLVWRLRSIANG